MYGIDDLTGIKETCAIDRADGERYKVFLLDAERKLERYKYDGRAEYDKGTH